jgi:cytochrome c553/mono/diheme cytochrome c family protein
MRKLAKIVGWALAVLVVVGLGAAGTAHLLAQRKLNRSIDVQVAPVAFVNDEASLARGKYLFQSRGCSECHGENGAGKLFIDAPNGMRVWTPNISPGPGSAVAKYSEADWVRTIRHGVKPDKRPILIMPSEDYNRFTDQDVAAIVAYARSLPPVQGETGRMELPLIFKAVYAAGIVPDAPQRIDHTLPPAKAVAEGPTPEHGAYVANMCKGCHGDRLNGGRIPGSPPDWPPAPDLTDRATYATYDSLQKFRAMLRSGKRPTGEAIKVMPFPSLGAMNDTDVEALYAFLKTLPKDPAGR